MILIDTSVWVGHLRSGNAALSALLAAGRVLGHPWVTGELSLGNLSRRAEVLALLQGLPQAVVARDDEVMQFVEGHALFGSGLGYVDAQLLAAVRITPDAIVWTADRRLATVADRLGVGYRRDRE